MIDIKIVKVVGGLGSQMMAYGLALALKANSPSSRVLCDFSTYRYPRYSKASHALPLLEKVFGIEEDYLPTLFSSLFYSKKLPLKLIRKTLTKLGVINIYSAEIASYNYDPLVFHQKGIVVFDQCWTSWKYFAQVRDKLRLAFKFPDLGDAQNIDAARKIAIGNSVALHVRRGDYLSSSELGGIANINYFKKAIETIDSLVDSPEYFIFSDDIEWCANNLNHLIESPLEFIDWNSGKDSFRDMQLMSLCRHHIISNSSFSAWSAYLSTNVAGVVIAPTHWATETSNIQLSDMIMPHWILIDNL